MESMTSLLLASVLLSSGQIPTVESPDLPRELQATAVTATVQVRNVTQGTEGSGVLVGKGGPFVYVLTAQHVVQGVESLEVAVFTADSYPRPKTTYRSAEVVAETKGLADLALLRIAMTDSLPSGLRLCPERLVPANRGFPGLSVGCEAGKAPTCLLAKVEGKKHLRREEKGETASFWEVDGKHHTGRSGGPLLDKGSHLLGVCSGTNRDKTYFTHPEEVRAFLKQHGFGWLAEDPARR
jgi:S1-C subfamily serine protease